MAVHQRQEAEGLAAEISRCRACPRLVAWREEVARQKRAAFADWDYWGRPVPGFGDLDAGIYVLGLAPAAHGANRTGRVFTGDRSGDFLYAALHRAGLANQPHAVSADDGLELHRCLPFAERELALIGPRVILCLGAFAWDAALRLTGPPPRPKPRFGHGAEHATNAGPVLLGCFHVSQQNTFTGRLTEPMIDAVLARAKDLTYAGSVG